MVDISKSYNDAAFLAALANLNPSLSIGSNFEVEEITVGEYDGIRQVRVTVSTMLSDQQLEELVSRIV